MNLINFDLKTYNQLLSNGSLEELTSFLQPYGLYIKDGKIVSNNPDDIKPCIEYWDKAQHIKKINLNSVYGILLQQNCRFFDKRLGQSITLTGRQIVKHMSAKVNEIITGKYDYLGESIIYGDSVTGDSIIRTSMGEIPISELYELCNNNYRHGTKEYATNHDIKVLGFNISEYKPMMTNIAYVMRHYTIKQLYKVYLPNGKTVTVTQDHSLMVERDGELLEVKPEHISNTDLFICYDDKLNQIVKYNHISIEAMGYVQDYVYDISINDENHVFFANDCLVHNTDSCHADTVIKSNYGDKTIESLFNHGETFWEEDTEHGIKEYSSNSQLQVASFDDKNNKPYYDNINYIYRHKVSKEKWEIEDEFGNKVIVTGDHSVMVERNGKMMEIKPRDMVDTDILITYHDNTSKMTRINSVIRLENFDDEYVYDIGMRNESTPWFFGNNILIHNSCYFSAYPTFKSDIENNLIKWDKDTVVKLYDHIGEMVNESFPDFMEKAFHCPHDRGEVIKSGREIVGENSLFITKKRYAVMVYDKEGKRKDKNGKPGEIKAMGLDLKRSDTPEYMQNFLSTILEKVLTNAEESVIINMIKEFRTEFKDKPGWEKGTPKRVNNIGKFLAQEEEKGKANMPGHVRASINWNILKKMNSDIHSMNIVDGFKVIVCKLKPNQMGFTSIAYPIDELRLPEWFKELPFDHDLMEETIIDNKLDNLLGVLDLDLESSKLYNTFNDLFEF
jgi:intein/homing endonuclease